MDGNSRRKGLIKGAENVSTIENKQTTAISTDISRDTESLERSEERMGSRSLPRTVGIYAMTLHSEECRGWISSRRAYRLINRLSFRPVYSRTWWKERSDNNARLRTKSLSIAHLNSGIIPALLLLSDPLPSLCNGCCRKRSLSLSLLEKLRRIDRSSLNFRWISKLRETIVGTESLQSVSRNETKRNETQRNGSIGNDSVRRRIRAVLFVDSGFRCWIIGRDAVDYGVFEFRVGETRLGGIRFRNYRSR